MIKEFKKSYNYFQHGIGREPDTNNIGGSFGRAAAGLLRMFTCKLFKLADLDEGLAIRIVEDSIKILFKMLFVWIIVSIIACSPDLFDQDFEVAQSIGLLFLVSWCLSLESFVDTKPFKEGNFEYYNKTINQRIVDVLKSIAMIIGFFAIGYLIIKIFQ